MVIFNSYVKLPEGIRKKWSGLIGRHPATGWEAHSAEFSALDAVHQIPVGQRSVNRKLSRGFGSELLTRHEDSR